MIFIIYQIVINKNAYIINEEKNNSDGKNYNN